MSVPENTLWLEAVRDYFEQALAEGDFRLAKELIADVFDQGFPVEARHLVDRLRATTQYAYNV